MQKKKKVKIKEKPHFKNRGLKVKVVGIGQLGCSIVSRLIKSEIPNVFFVAISNDSKSLVHSSAHQKIKIEKANFDLNSIEKFTETYKKDISEVLKGADLIFLIADLRNDFMSYILPFIAEICQELNILTFGLLIKPFFFEGSYKMELAEKTIDLLKGKIDALISLSNDRILKMVDKSTPISEAFRKIDEIFKQLIFEINQILNLNGLINIDLTDLKTILKNAGPTFLGIGTAEGENRAVKLVKEVIENSPFDFSIKGAKGVIFIVRGGDDLTIYEVNEIAKQINELVDKDCRINFAVLIDKELTGKIKLTLIANHFTPAVQTQQQILIKPQLLPEKKIEIEKININLEEKTKQIKKEKDQEDELEIPTFLRKKIK